MAAPRDIRDVIGAIIAIAFNDGQTPSTAFLDGMAGLVYDVWFTAPEAMSIRWNQFSQFLGAHATGATMIRVFRGLEPYEQWLPRIPETWRFVLDDENPTEKTTAIRKYLAQPSKA